ncbi:MAG TPA: dihydrolipoamide acetyltransferase family protein [Terriglobia bacterium]|nr:dihydrolipoamide acetyltransferase family protein [Terriglobia bacterium]
MPFNVIMPQMGESVAEGTVVRWIKKLGDRVERDEPLLEISTDKVDAEIPSPTAGILRKILVKENETVEVNTVIAEIESEGATDSHLAAAALNATASAEPTALIEAAGSTSANEPVRQPQEAQKVRSSPLVRKMAQEHEIDLGRIEGTGLGGRITKKDILDYLARPAGGAAAQPESKARVAVPSSSAGESPSVAPPAATAFPVAQHGVSAQQAIEFTGATKVVPMTPMRRQIAEHMVMSKHTAPHVACVFEVEMTKVAGTIATDAAEFERRNGIKLTYTPFLIRAAVEALKQFPIVNSSIEGGNIIYKRDVNIGVAVALETGLIVPVIKRADEKSFLGIARAVQDLAGRARTKRLSVEDVQEGTFTLSNHGITGSLIGTPVISQPQVAILAVGKIEKRPVVRDDAIAIRNMVYLTLSFDHRILDGAIADHFMSRIKSALENWDEPVL